MNKNAFCPTPPMGWNSYDYYGTAVTEEQVKANARAMAEKLKPFGWEYVVIDISWYAHGADGTDQNYFYLPFNTAELDEYARLQPDPARFPSAAGGQGFKPLADYIHSLGLKFGIHIMRGIHRQAAHQHLRIMGTDTTADHIAEPNNVCRWNPYMYGVRNTPEGQAYYDSIIQQYADWGVDFIKCDDICNTDNLNDHTELGYARKHEIEMLSSAIQKAGRPIVLSLSPGPAIIQKSWHYAKHANMWRISDDFWDEWPLLKDMFPRCEIWQDHVKAGCYPDCDMLPVGRLGGGFGRERATGFTRDEQRTMMNLWCLFGSPLMVGAELSLLDDWTLSLLTNQKVLAMLTPDCRPDQIRRTEDEAVWVAENQKTGERYLGLFNLSDQEQEVAMDFGDLWPETAQGEELWSGEAVPVAESRLAARLAPHASAMYRLS